MFRKKSKQDSLALFGDAEEGTIKIGKNEYTRADVEAWPDASLICYKQRENGLEPKYDLWFAPESKRFTERRLDPPRPYVQFSAPQVVKTVIQKPSEPVMWEMDLIEEVPA